jgi:hypothetical protein
MGFGGQSRGLIQASKTQGWDPTVIPGHGSMADFDKAPERDPTSRSCVGRIPGGPPSVTDASTDHPVMSPKESFNAPDYSRETPKHTNGANPFAGMGGE